MTFAVPYPLHHSVVSPALVQRHFFQAPPDSKHPSVFRHPPKSQFFFFASLPRFTVSLSSWVRRSLTIRRFTPAQRRRPVPTVVSMLSHPVCWRSCVGGIGRGPFAFVAFFRGCAAEYDDEGCGVWRSGPTSRTRTRGPRLLRLSPSEP